MKIQAAQFLKHLPFLCLGILSWLGFSYLFILYIKILQGRSLSNFPWHSDAPLWEFRYCLAGAAIMTGVKWSGGLLSEKSKSVGRDFLILVLLIPLIALLLTAFGISVLGVSYTGSQVPTAYDWVMDFLHQTISQSFVCLSCIGYFYLTLVRQTKEKLVQVQRARTEMELKTLRQNIEPHFLFNNLNVLSSLIDSNPEKANDFLSRLAELYRYILQTQALEVVPVRDELAFAENYVYLLQVRFGEAYNFVWEVPEKRLDGQLIVPAAWQTLIENAVKHNAGSHERPLPILIKLEEEFVTVENEVREKLQTRPTSQTGLQNLAARYSFLTDRPVEIERAAGIYKVKLPLITPEKED